MSCASALSQLLHAARLAVESGRQCRMWLAGHVALFEDFVQAYATMARERCFVVGQEFLPYFLVGRTILAVFDLLCELVCSHTEPTPLC